MEIVFGDGDEIAMKMALGEIEVCMLPVPNTTSILVKNALGSGVGISFDLGEEWEKVCENGSSLTMGCIAVRREFAEKHPEAVAEFLSRCESSVNFVLSDPNGAAQLIAKHGITGSSEIALYAIPDSGIEWLTGDEIKSALAGYLDVLFSSDPASVGGAMPDDGFYYANAEYEKNK